MTYDPDPRRRKRRSGKVPPQLRAWVYGGRRRTHDPRRKGMARGYGKVRGKPFRVGSRGGAYWSGSRKPRYDPAPRRSWRSYVHRPTKKGIMATIGKITNVVPAPLGFTLGLMADPMAGDRGLKGSVGFIKDRVMKYRVPSVNTLQWWLFDEKSPNTYKAPVLGGLGLGVGGQILTSLNIHPMINKVFRPLSKFGYGLFAGGVVGMFAWLGASEGTAYTKTPSYVTGSHNSTNVNMNIGGYA